jgi:hypothetical protein
LVGIGFGRNHPDLATTHAQASEKGAHLRLAPLDAGQGFDLGLRVLQNSAT